MERTLTTQTVCGTNLQKSGHTVFRTTSTLAPGSFLEKKKNKKGGKLSVHHNGDLLTAELLFRTISSVNHLRVFGAISDWCAEMAQYISSFVFQRGEARSEYE